jgi:hypothetical protein
MLLNVTDKSNYIKGLLVLIKKKNAIGEPIKKSVKHITKILDFNQEFIDESMKGLMTNNFIVDDPPKFSNYQLAECFLKDGLHIAFSDGILNFNQVEWLINTAKKNNLSEQWFFIELEEYFNRCKLNLNMQFEI